MLNLKIWYHQGACPDFSRGRNVLWWLHQALSCSDKAPWQMQKHKLPWKWEFESILPCRPLLRIYTCDMRAQSLNTRPEFRISRLFRGLCWAQPWCKTFQMHLGSRFVWPGNLLFFQFFVFFFNFSEMLRCSDLDPSGNAQNRTHLLFVGGLPTTIHSRLHDIV